MLGLSLHGWENSMVVFLIIAGGFALLAGAATWAVVRLQRIEIAESNNALERYKADAATALEATRAEAARANEASEQLRNETARLTADNLSLQTVLLPRRVGLIGLNEEPKAKVWFAGFDRWAGIKVLIQVVPGDPEAQNLANEIAFVLSKFGWKPEFIDEKRSGVSLNLREGLVVMSPSSYKSWDPTNEAQKTFAMLNNAAISLAKALTDAGLGIGSHPVMGTRGAIMVVDFPPDSEGEAHNLTCSPETPPVLS